MSIIFSTPTQAAQRRIPNSAAVTVHVYDYAGVTRATLARSQTEAARILRHAGIESVWRNCALTPDELRSNRACESPVRRARYEVRILSGEMAVRLGARRGELGVAHFPERQGTGCVASIFYNSVAALVAALGDLRANLSPAIILAHAMAHELGHLLLGRYQHSARGLMRAHWRDRDLQRAARGKLLFTASQATRMRTRVASATRAQSQLAD